MPVYAQEEEPQTDFFEVFENETIFIEIDEKTILFPEPDEDSTADIALADAVFIINSFTFNIKGITRPYALINAGELIKGEEIKGFNSLEFYIQDKTQILFNERVLDNVSIDYTIGEAGHDGKYPVDLVINTTDTWNIIAIPRPQYSSSSGFDVTIKARDYNFLGTMYPLRVDLGYSYDEEGNTTFHMMIDSGIPFRLFDLNWHFDFDHYFDYRPDTEEPYYYRNDTGLSVELPVGFTTLKLGFDESLIYNLENSDSDKPKYGNFQEGPFLRSNPYLSWKIPTGVEVGNFGELSYTPRASATFNHEISGYPLADFRTEPSLSFGHSLSFGRIDWIGNFRKGLSANFSNSYSYSFFNQKNDKRALDTSINLRGIGHLTFNDMFGISGRVIYRHWFFDDYTDKGGDVLRGIIDKEVSANNMLSMNLDLNIRLYKVRPSIWFEEPKMRIFDFDFHVVPIFDAAFYRSHKIEEKYGDYDFTMKNMLVTAGLEVVLFPIFFRSLFLRASLGINLSTLLNTSRYELFIGTEFHY
jgi:hypothetical protein